MSPKFYWFLWVLFAVSAGVLWLGGVFTLLTVVIFGFIAFGLTFMGMMCVLPGVVSHPPVKNAEIRHPTAHQLPRPSLQKRQTALPNTDRHDMAGRPRNSDPVFMTQE